MVQYYAMRQTEGGFCLGFMNESQKDAYGEPPEGITLVPFQTPENASMNDVIEAAEAACSGV